MQKKWMLMMAFLALVGGYLLQTVLTTQTSVAFEHGVFFNQHRGAPNITLLTSRGEEKSWPLLNDWHLVFFGFTYCPDICPTTLYELKRVQQEIPSLNVVFVSLDPERDTPKRLEQYLSRLGPAFIGATNKGDVLEQLTDFFTVAYQKVGDGDNYTIDHSGTVFLVDDQGHWRGLFGHGTSPENMAADLKKIYTQNQ